MVSLQSNRAVPKTTTVTGRPHAQHQTSNTKRTQWCFCTLLTQIALFGHFFLSYWVFCLCIIVSMFCTFMLCVCVCDLCYVSCAFSYLFAILSKKCLFDCFLERERERKGMEMDEVPCGRGKSYSMEILFSNICYILYDNTLYTYI